MAENAEVYGGDASKIFLSGHSSGEPMIRKLLVMAICIDFVETA